MIPSACARPGRLVVLIGASGSGKTTIASAIEHRYRSEVAVFYFDRIGIPPVERMVAENGSVEEWQRSKTIEWMAKLAPLSNTGRAVLFEGQTRLAFLDEGARAAAIAAYTPILVDCDDATRVRRLTFERQQPELADETMMNWARYLRRDARRHGCTTLDTSGMLLDECVAQVLAHLRGST